VRAIPSRIGPRSAVECAPLLHSALRCALATITGVEARPWELHVKNVGVEQCEPASVGGYRVVRKLGEGERAEIFLGLPIRGESGEGPVALKVYRAHVDQGAIIREIEALSRAAGPHVVRLQDVVIGSTSALILERLARGGLARLLCERELLDLGEAITVLAPVVSALSRMHAAGCMHFSLSADTVLFSRDGAPILTGFGSARSVRPGVPPAGLTELPGVVTDLRSLASLASLVLNRVDDRRAHELARWADDIQDPLADDWCEQLTARLFDLDQAAPIRFAAVTGHTSESEGRVVVTVPELDAREKPPSIAHNAMGVPDWLKPLLDRAPANAIAAWAHCRRVVHSVRAPVWVVGGVTALVVGVAGIVIPHEPPTAAVAPTASPEAAERDATERDVRDPAQTAILEDDAVAAAVVLLRTRQQCREDLSVLCLDSVAQQGSSALATDQKQIRDAQNGGELAGPIVATESDLSVVEQIGAAVLLEWADPTETEPASLLLMKGEAGWRIRDYLEQ
jgi:hypothetical protein